MPRGVKGSGKEKAAAKNTATSKRPYHRKAKSVEAAVATPVEASVTEIPVTEALVETAPVSKTHKPYPTADERIAMADQQIDRLTKLNAARTALVEKTAGLLAERQDALAKSTTALEKAVARKERLIAAKNKPAKAPKEKLTVEERKARMAAGRAAKKAENEKYAALVAALKDSGKSVDDLLAELKG